MRGKGPPPIPYAPRGVLVDSHGRRLRYLRLSVTDRCNYRCVYCMPDEGGPQRDRRELLTLEETARLGRLLCEMGFDKIRLTGGEPTIRSGLPRLIRSLRGTPGLRDLSMTTNGWNLAREAQTYRDAGLARVNISLDTLDPERYRQLTRVGRLQRVLDGIDLLLRMRWTPVKINMVVMRGVNEHEAVRMVDRYIDHPVDIRFIEFMPFQLTDDRTVPWSETRSILEPRYRLVPDGPCIRSGPETRFRIAGSPCRVATIASISSRFCGTCNRLRLQSNGRLRLCIASPEAGASLREALRAGATDDELEQQIRAAVEYKPGAYRVDGAGRPRFEGHLSQLGG